MVRAWCFIFHLFLNFTLNVIIYFYNDSRFVLCVYNSDMRVTHENRESTPVGQNSALNVRPPSVNGKDKFYTPVVLLIHWGFHTKLLPCQQLGAYDSSSTSSESPEGSVSHLKTFTSPSCIYCKCNPLYWKCFMHHFTLFLHMYCFIWMSAGRRFQSLSTVCESPVPAQGYGLHQYFRGTGFKQYKIMRHRLWECHWTPEQD